MRMMTTCLRSRPGGARTDGRGGAAAAAALRLKAFADETAEAGLSLAEQNRRVTETAWQLSRRRGPALVLGFGSLPYPAVHLSASRGAAAEGAGQAAAARSEAHRQSVRMLPFFPASRT